MERGLMRHFHKTARKPLLTFDFPPYSARVRPELKKVEIPETSRDRGLGE